MIISNENILEEAGKGMVYADYPSITNHRVRILATGINIQYSFGTLVNVKSGFQWDEASVPWIISFMFPKSGKYAYPALPHDVAYYGKFCTREQADKEFLKYSLIVSNKFQSYARYIGVRAFGWIWWYKKPSEMAISNMTKINVL